MKRGEQCFCQALGAKVLLLDDTRGDNGLVRVQLLETVGPTKIGIYDYPNGIAAGSRIFMSEGRLNGPR